jgi:hypothetical protein
VLRGKHEIHAALHHLLATLRASGMIPQRHNSDPLSQELTRFDSYMLQVRGLASSTRRQRVLIVRRFLRAQQRGKHFETGRISVKGIRTFVLPGDGKYSAGTVRVLGGALRCYLRFLALEGDNVEHLREAVPSAAHWRLTGVPELLSGQELRNLLDSFRDLKHSPKRAYAMVRCLTDLGLRAPSHHRISLNIMKPQTGLSSGSPVATGRGTASGASLFLLPKRGRTVNATRERAESAASKRRSDFHSLAQTQAKGSGQRDTKP